MKRLIIEFLLFTIVVIVLAIGLILLSEYAVKYKENQLLKLDEDINIVFAGDSHVECAVDDKLIVHSINIAQSGEAYLYSYAKIKGLIKNNRQISTIFIGFSYGSILMEKEVSWLFGEEYVIEKIQYYNYLLDFQERKLLLQNNPTAYLKGLTKSIYNNFEAFLKSQSHGKSKRQLTNFGGYKYLLRDKLDADPGKELYQAEPVEKSLLQEKYLKMISELCRRESVRLVLFVTPKYKLYNTNVDSVIKQLWSDVRDELSADSLMDMSAFNLPDSCYGDLTHINFRGAAIFSSHLNKLLNPMVADTLLNSGKTN